MTKQNRIQLFEQKQVWTLWDEDAEKCADVVGVLIDSIDPTAYWRKLKQRLKEEGNETVTNCHGLKMRAVDGKMRMTDVADTEQLFRLMQLESETGQKVVTSLNAKLIHHGQLEENTEETKDEE